MSPVVSVELLKWDVPIHGLDLFLGHGDMGSQCLEKLNLDIVLNTPVISDVGNQAGI